MNAIATLADWWNARAPRERVMLLTMLAALAAFVLWLAVWRPLHAAADAARAHRLQATATLAEVRAQVAAIARLRAQRPPPSDSSALAKTVLQAAAAERVPVSRQRTDPAGAFIVGIDAVAAPALFAWLDALGRQHGVAPAKLEIRERGGQLAVEAGFAAGVRAQAVAHRK